MEKDSRVLRVVGCEVDIRTDVELDKYTWSYEHGIKLNYRTSPTSEDIKSTDRW